MGCGIASGEKAKQLRFQSGQQALHTCQAANNENVAQELETEIDGDLNVNQ